jgi:hypothetical protein
MRVIAGVNSDETTVLVIRRKNMPTEIVQATVELTGLLGLRFDASEYQVAYAEVAKNDTELAILTRSTLTVMLELAGQIHVPPEHIAEGRTPPSRFDTQQAEPHHRLIEIRHNQEKPDDAFVAIKYRDYWFWVDDRDFKSKRTLAYLMLLFSLTETGGKEGLPLVTIPAG